MTAKVIEKPWGTEEVIFKNGDDFLIKRLVVQPGHKTSLQVHREKDETLTVVEGWARLLKDGQELDLGEMSVVALPRYCVHRISNLSKDPLVIIEVSQGKDTVVRLADDYGRVTE